MQQSTNNYSVIKDVYDETVGEFLTPDGKIYTIPDEHTVEVRFQLGINSRTKNFLLFKGTATLEMWDFKVYNMFNTNFTPTNYDGSIVFGGIQFYYNYPNLVLDVPLMTTVNSYYAQGLQYVNSGKVYVKIYDTSSYVYVNKQINNS